MVILRNPYSGGVMTVDVSKVGRLLELGWVYDQPPGLVDEVVPLGQETVSPVKPPEVTTVEGAPKGNASRAVWRDYAEGMGIDTDGMTRAEIRAKVEEETKG